MADRTTLDLPTIPKGLLPRVSRAGLTARPVLAGRQLAASGVTGPVLNFRGTNGWATVGGPWSGGVSTAAATFEVWIRTTQRNEQTLFIGSIGTGATPRISVGDDQLAVYWSETGDAPSWRSSDTTPVTDGLWHHIAVVFSGGSITFVKDGVATADRLAIPDTRPAGGTLQLGAGFGTARGFVGQLYGAQVWSVARTTAEVGDYRWASLSGTTPGLTALVTWDQATQQTTNQMGGATAGIDGGNVITTDLPAFACALAFDGTGTATWPIVPLDGAGISSLAATFEAWLKIATPDAGTATTICAVSKEKLTSVRIEYLGGQRLGFTAAGVHIASTDTTTIADGTWHHVAVVFDNNNVRLFKDGVQTGDQPTVATQQIKGLPSIGEAAGGASNFHGVITDVRVWSVARSAVDISAFRTIRMTPEIAAGDLKFLCDLTTNDPSNPSSWAPFDNVGNVRGQLDGGAAVVAVGPPSPAMPQQVWTYPTTGISPVGPVLSTGAVLGLDATAADAVLRSIDPQAGQQIWSYDVRASSGLDAILLPAALTSAGGVIYVGVQSSTSSDGQAQVQAVNAVTGQAVWAKPATVQAASRVLTRPAILAGNLYLGVDIGAGAVAWGDPTTGTLTVNFVFGEMLGFMTDPVIDANNVYVGSVSDAAVMVTAISATATNESKVPVWQTSLDREITTDLVLANDTLFVATGGTIHAMRTADGSPAWTTTLSTAAVTGRPVLIDTTLYAGSQDGTVYALDTTTGAVQWQVDTGSPITTDLINENGVLYFATAGDGADLPPAFYAVDTLSLGADVLMYAVPEADNILFAQGGALDGVVYFYGSQDIYAVNMSNVVREFSVNTKLLVESYDTTSIARSDGEPTGSDTAYRISIAIRDENGVARPQYPVKVWSADTLFVTNQGDTLTLSPTNQQWMQTDGSGDLTLAVSAYDIGTPDGGTPNLACPALIVWAPFMAPGETVVIFPDHESLANLSAVQGSTPASEAATAGTLYLDSATGYDGSPMILSDYHDPSTLGNIASAVRNTVGARNPANGAAAVHLAGHQGTNRYVREGLLPNVVYSSDPASPTTRQWYPGEFGTFTATIGATAADFLPNEFDDALIDPKQHNPFTHIEDFAKNVIHGAEKVAKMAWKFVENAVNTVIQTAENVYQLTITTLEDAVTAVAGFLKSVVSDLKKALQWLSALFKWKNILANHTYLRNCITNTSKTGAFDVMSTWVNNELSGAGTDVTSFFAAISGKGSSSMMASSTATAGQTVGSKQAGGNNDSSTVYNQGGNNNANQCTWMRQKTTENAGGGSVGTRPTGDLSASFSDALTQYFEQLSSALVGDFANLPDQIRQSTNSTKSSFKDPKSLVSTGVSDLIGFFTAIADLIIDFAEQVATDTLKFLQAMLDDLVSWLGTPITIPFVSDLYKLLTGDDLSILDLVCLLAAVPGTILLDVITGSPTIPTSNDVVPAGSVGPGTKAGVILFAIGSLAIGELGCALDIYTTDWSAVSPTWYTAPRELPPVILDIFIKIDITCDLLAWAMSFAGSILYGEESGNHLEYQDYCFQVMQLLPVVATAGLTLGLKEYSGKDQCGNDVGFAVFGFLFDAVIAACFPGSYRDAPKAPGLVLVTNILTQSSSICEFMLLGETPQNWLIEEAVVKFALFTVASILAFTATILTVAG